MFLVWEESRVSKQSVGGADFGLCSTGVRTCFCLPPVSSRKLVGYSAVFDAVALHQIPALVWQFRRDRYARDARVPSLSPNLTDATGYLRCPPDGNRLAVHRGPLAAPELAGADNDSSITCV